MRFLSPRRFSMAGPIALLAASAVPLGCEAQVLDPLPLDQPGGSGTGAAGGAGCGTAGNSAGGSDGGGCTEESCPASPPTDGNPCRDIRGDCEYDETTCDCHDQAWVCWDLSDCPEARPESGSDCPRVGIECDYGPRRCDCEGQGWDCREQ